MAGFKGKELYSIDEKGRVSFPAKMQKFVQGKAKRKFSVTRGWDRQNCLQVYPQAEWERIEANLRATLNPYVEKDRVFLREIAEHTEELDLDKTGRLCIPRHLLELAGIEKQVLLVGVFDHIELWNPERYVAVQQGAIGNISDLAAEVMGRSRA